jgi:hypothetical protein
MNPSTLGFLGFLGFLGLLAAQAAAPPTSVGPVPDVAIKTRRTFEHDNSSISTTIIYIKGARQRREDIVDWPPQVSARTGSKRTHMGTHITQCDERRTVLLNDEARTYAYSPIEDPSAYLRRAQTAASRPPPPEPTGGDVTITIDAVDTGERRTMGRFIAAGHQHDHDGTGSRDQHSCKREQTGWLVHRSALRQLLGPGRLGRDVRVPHRRACRYPA